jgi:hypothetical protein
VLLPTSCGVLGLVRSYLWHHSRAMPASTALLPERVKEEGLDRLALQSVTAM